MNLLNLNKYELSWWCYLVAKSYPTLLQPMKCILPGSSVHGIFRQEYWSGLPFPSPGDLPDRGIGPVSPALAGGFFTTKPPEKPHELSDLSFYCTIHNESILSKKFAVNKYVYNHCLKLRNTLSK